MRFTRDAFFSVSSSFFGRRDKQEVSKGKNIDDASASRDGGEGADEMKKTEHQVPWQYMLPTLSAKAAANPKLRVLDVGCGNGSITIELAKLVPEGEVTGVDVSAGMLESAKVFAEVQGVRNVKFVQGDVYALPWRKGEFDVVCAHQVVAHCKEPVEAIREMVRVSKKAGGVVCVREGDLLSGRFGPEWPVLEECFRVVVDVHRGNGGTPDAGSRLGEWVEKAGVPKRKCVETCSEARYDTLEKRKEYGGKWPARCTQGAFADRAMALGFERARLDEFALAWKKWIHGSDAYLTMTNGEVIAHL